MARTGTPASWIILHCRNLKPASLKSSSVSFCRTLREFGPAMPSTPISSVTLLMFTSQPPSAASVSIHLGSEPRRKMLVVTSHLTLEHHHLCCWLLIKKQKTVGVMCMCFYLNFHLIFFNHMFLNWQGMTQVKSVFCCSRHQRSLRSMKLGTKWHQPSNRATPRLE